VIEAPLALAPQQEPVSNQGGAPEGRENDNRALDHPTGTMYTYIMHRTQIYLTEAEDEALGRESRRTGRTRSLLIREAIVARYLGRRGEGELETALRETAGSWKGAKRATGREHVERLRSGRRLATVVARKRSR
jgi:hypothetical protein